MAFQTMIRDTNSDYSGRRDDNVYYHKETKSSGTNGEPVIIPTTVKKVVARLIISSGSGSIQTSASSIAEIKAGTANWITWDDGVVSVTTDAVAERVNAMRVVRATGTVVMELLAS